jgi:hypothetical protein
MFLFCFGFDLLNYDELRNRKRKFLEISARKFFKKIFRGVGEGMRVEFSIRMAHVGWYWSRGPDIRTKRWERPEWWGMR